MTAAELFVLTSLLSVLKSLCQNVDQIQDMGIGPVSNQINQFDSRPTVLALILGSEEQLLYAI